MDFTSIEVVPSTQSYFLTFVPTVTGRHPCDEWRGEQINLE